MLRYSEIFVVRVGIFLSLYVRVNVLPTRLLTFAWLSRIASITGKGNVRT